MTTATIPTPAIAAPDRVELSAHSLLESLLFVASGPVSAARLAAALETTPAAVTELLRALEADYAGRGLRLQWSGGLVQLTTAAEAAAFSERFLGREGTSSLAVTVIRPLSVSALMPKVPPLTMLVLVIVRAPLVDSAGMPSWARPLTTPCTVLTVAPLSHLLPRPMRAV